MDNQRKLKVTKEYQHVNIITWYLTLNPLHPWNIAPGNEEWINESIIENFSFANHHLEKIRKGIPPCDE